MTDSATSDGTSTSASTSDGAIAGTNTGTSRATGESRPTGPGARPRATDVAAAIDALQGFCLGPDGRAAAAAELRKLGLPTGADHVDDVCQAVLVRVWARLEAGDPIADRDLHAGIVAYARRSIRNATVDLLRTGRTDRLAELLVAVDGRDASEPAGLQADPSTDLDDRQPTPWSDDDADRAFAPTVRWAVQCLQMDKPRIDAWVVSAALTTSHLADHPDLTLVPGTPTPAPQSPAASAGPRWAGLAYAGRRDCWATPETGAVRERRSRALKRVDQLLGDAISLARTARTDVPADGAAGQSAGADADAVVRRELDRAPARGVGR